jgi:cysteate synthase
MHRHYQLYCRECGAILEDDGVILKCPAEHSPGLLITSYATEKFEPDPSESGFYRYRSWLPIVRTLPQTGAPVAYQSQALCQLTKLPNLWISFNGCWEERGCALRTGTFKELEAYGVLSRLPAEDNGVIVVASAGNTAAAFAEVCSQNSIPCLIIIPEIALERLQYDHPMAGCVKIVSLTGKSDYSDAIYLAERVSKKPGFVPEGGVKNVARRDGLGIPMLNAVETIGRLPDYYFQAVGSGTGGIAVHEAATRLLKDGRFGSQYPRLMLSQNLPFTPLYFSWKLQRRSLLRLSQADEKVFVSQVASSVLSNRNPPYSINGGVFDVLTESKGDMLVAENAEVRYAAELFRQQEGIDIEPASAVAFATLIKAATYRLIEPEAVVLLNITGGGWLRKKAMFQLSPVVPDLEITQSQLRRPETIDKVSALF